MSIVQSCPLLQIRDKSVRKKIWRHLYELLHAEKEDNLDGLVKQFCDHWGKAEKCKTFVKVTKDSVIIARH